MTTKIGIILIYSCWTAIVVLAFVAFSFDNLREKGSVPLTNSQGLHVLKILVAHQLEITELD